MTSDPERHALYRFYTTSGQLLYVGITNNPPSRFEQHGQTKDWWSQVAGITIEWHDSRQAVLAAERRAVQVEQPMHNILLRRENRRRAPAPVAGANTQQVVWKCDGCHLPVADGDGWVHVVYREMEPYRAGMLAHQEKNRQLAAWASMDVSELLDLPDPARWWVHHKKCDPNLESNDYVIDVERIRTYPQVIGWAAHLMEKRWLDDTNWDEVLQSIATQGRREPAL